MGLNALIKGPIWVHLGRYWCRLGTTAVQSNTGGTHLTSQLTFSPAATAVDEHLPKAQQQQPPVTRPGVLATRAEVLLALIDSSIGGSGRPGGVEVARNAATEAADDARFGTVDCSTADAVGFLLHPAVGDACIHIAAIPGRCLQHCHLIHKCLSWWHICRNIRGDGSMDEFEALARCTHFLLGFWILMLAYNACAQYLGTFCLANHPYCRLEEEALNINHASEVMGREDLHCYLLCILCVQVWTQRDRRQRSPWRLPPSASAGVTADNSADCWAPQQCGPPSLMAPETAAPPGALTTAAAAEAAALTAYWLKWCDVTPVSSQPIDVPYDSQAGYL